MKDATFDYIPSNIQIGDDSYINRNCSFYVGWKKAPIYIGNNVHIGPNVTFMCINHHITDDCKNRTGPEIYSGIVIKDGCWIGSNCLILPGTVINEGVVVAGGAVARGELISNKLYAGVPAKAVRNL